MTAHHDTLARISYQRFFRRYLRLAGMTGTAREVAGELWTVYGLPVLRVPTNRPSRRVILRERVYVSAEARWAAVVNRVRALHGAGRPVLVGTRSVAASEELSARLAASGAASRSMRGKTSRRRRSSPRRGKRGASRSPPIWRGAAPTSASRPT